ncbi:hypothetical protein Enr13x_54590 [Stieleria neptunia]|uniref:Uncharacterized protein n=1 Tax=Stieleria neptunia TaxID=2527979 RepID=A0A518HXJ3_9BACT|nr:hypothetical protein [Stieleria neptunia]QDV45580.1 hypothetical protein Enr13x_54590 [Stieleria neptunia]
MRLAAFFLTTLFVTIAIADDGLLDDDDNTTAAGDILESRGELATGLGKGAYLRSLSAEQLQQALALRLKNRKERVEQYYELRDLRDEEIAEENEPLSEEKRREIGKRMAPDRLSENQIDRQSGELYWPRPLDHRALGPYRRPIEETFAKRSSPGEVYRRMDYAKVHRMVNLIHEAVDSIKDKLDPQEFSALKSYLRQIDYEARFNGADERVDY